MRRHHTASAPLEQCYDRAPGEEGGLSWWAVQVAVGLAIPEVRAQPAPIAAEAPRDEVVERERWLRALVVAGDWAGLRTESLRWAYETSDPAIAARARFYEGWALLQAGDPEAAVLRLTALADEAPVAWRPTAQLAAAYAWRGLDPGLAEHRYARIVAEPGSAVADQASLGLAWTLADQARFAEALEVLPASAPPELVELLERPRWRRGGVAAWMSAVVPGSGQLYAGAPREAVAAFLVVGGLGAGTVVLATRGQRGGAIALGVVTGTFWLGNIYGAADAATRANRRRRRRATRLVEGMETPVWPGIAELSAAPAPR